MMLATDPSKQAESERLSREMADYLAAGGEIKRLGPGEFGFDALSKRAKINPVVLSSENHARKMQQGKTERAPVKRTASGRRSRAKPPEQHKPRTRNGPERNRPGTLQHEALQALTKPMTARQLAELKGWTVNSTMVRLTRLRDCGAVVSTGSHGNMRWERKCP